jgi:hypothetical protein
LYFALNRSEWSVSPSGVCNSGKRAWCGRPQTDVDVMAKEISLSLLGPEPGFLGLPVRNIIVISTEEEEIKLALGKFETSGTN